MVASYFTEYLALLYKLFCGLPSQFYEVFDCIFWIKNSCFLHGIPEFSKTFFQALPYNISTLLCTLYNMDIRSLFSGFVCAIQLALSTLHLKKNISTYICNVRKAAVKLTLFLLPLVGVNGRIRAGRMVDILIVWSACSANRHEHRWKSRRFNTVLFSLLNRRQLG